jgi:hypothetical protein
MKIIALVGLLLAVAGNAGAGSDSLVIRNWPAGEKGGVMFIGPSEVLLPATAALVDITGKLTYTLPTPTNLAPPSLVKVPQGCTGKAIYSPASYSTLPLILAPSVDGVREGFLNIRGNLSGLTLGAKTARLLYVDKNVTVDIDFSCAARGSSAATSEKGNYVLSRGWNYLITTITGLNNGTVTDQVTTAATALPVDMGWYYRLR